MECPTCGQEYEEAAEGRCPHCGTRIESEASQPPPPPTDPPPGPEVIPFEDRSLSFWDRLAGTIRLVITNPNRAFSILPDGSIEQPLLFGLIVSTFAIAVGNIVALLFKVPLLGMMGEGDDQIALHGIMALVAVVLSPILAAIGLFLVAGVFHLLLMLFGDAQRGFNTTFRVVAYASTTDLLMILPLCGGFVAMIWGAVLCILGATKAHETDAWRAVLAYLLPIFVCCCLPLMWLFMIGMLSAIAEGH